MSFTSSRKHSRTSSASRTRSSRSTTTPTRPYRRATSACPTLSVTSRSASRRSEHHPRPPESALASSSMDVARVNLGRYPMNIKLIFFDYRLILRSYFIQVPLAYHSLRSPFQLIRRILTYFMCFMCLMCLMCFICFMRFTCFLRIS